MYAKYGLNIAPDQHRMLEMSNLLVKTEPPTLKSSHCISIELEEKRLIEKQHLHVVFTKQIYPTCQVQQAISRDVSC